MQYYFRLEHFIWKFAAFSYTLPVCLTYTTTPRGACQYCPASLGSLPAVNRQFVVTYYKLKARHYVMQNDWHIQIQIPEKV